MKDIKIGANDAGQRVDRFLSKQFPGLSSSMMYKAIRQKKIKVNRKRCTHDQKLQEGDVILLFLPPMFLEEKHHDIPIYTGDLDIVIETGDLLIVNKPAGLLSQSDQNQAQDTLVERVRYYLYAKGEYDPQKENVFAPSLCHRLDRNTSGLVIAAKNARALRLVNDAIAHRRIHKYYRAHIQGRWDSKKSSLCFYIRKEQTKAQVSNQKKAGYVQASMDVKLLQQERHSSWVEVELHTGRFHQIRAGLSYYGHPLLYDVKYGAAQKGKLYELCAYRLVFEDINLDLPVQDIRIS